MKKPRPNPTCPKCRGKNIVLQEWSHVSMEFHVCEDGRIRRVWGFMDPELSNNITAHCGSCKHKWKLRGVSQVIEFEGHKWNKEPEEKTQRDFRGEEDLTCDCDSLTLGEGL